VKYQQFQSWQALKSKSTIELTLKQLLWVARILKADFKCLDFDSVTPEQSVKSSEARLWAWASCLRLTKLNLSVTLTFADYVVWLK